MTDRKLVIRDLPGIADLEVDLMMRRGAYEGVEEDLVSKVALNLFGVSAAELSDLYEQHEDEDDLLTAWEMADDRTMAELLSIGIDFSDERGHPLRCTNLLAGFAEVAAKGLAGHMPDRSQAILDHMASKLEQEREAFMSDRRKSKRP